MLVEPVWICEECESRLFSSELAVGTIKIRALPDGPEKEQQVELEPVDSVDGDYRGCLFCSE